MRAPPQAVVDVRSRAFARRENGSGHRSHGSAAGAGRCTSRMFAYITGARDSGRARGVFPRGVLREWRQLLDASPLPVLLALLRSPDDEAVRLRQSSPFAGLLTPEERRSILREYESRRA